MKIVKEIKNNLLKRKEVVFSIEAESNPGFATVEKELVTHTGVPSENVVIKSVRNNFGSRIFFVEAYVYDSKAQKELIEPKTKARKEGGKQ